MPGIEEWDCPEELTLWEILDMGENGTPNRAEENALIANMQTREYLGGEEVYWT